MYSHLFVGSDNLEASKKFYDATFAVLGGGPGWEDDRGRLFYMANGGILGITKPINGEPATFGNGTTIGLTFDSAEKVDAWHAAGVANGGTACEDPPGVRDLSIGKQYLAYLRDPTGNKLCAVYQIKD